MKTAKEMADEIIAAKASGATYVTYGDSDLGMPVAIDDAIADIMGMDDEVIGDGTWYECDEHGEIIE